MSLNETKGLQFEEEGRLPWLEATEEVAPDGVSFGRLITVILCGLAIIGIVVGGLWWWQGRASAGRGELIAAPAGPERVPPPAEPGRFDGDGNAAVAAAEGVRPQGRVDASALPEAPIAPPRGSAARPVQSVPVNRPAQAAQSAAADTAGQGAQAPSATPVGTSVTAPVRRSVAVPAAAGVHAAPAGNSGMIQLGSFASESTANRAWAGLKERFTWLAPVNASVASAEVNGRTVYRLRAAAGSTSNARTLCNRLRVAGENCIVL